MNFTDTFKHMRQAAGVTQRTIARTLGVSETSVYYWEAGLRMPSVDNVVKLERLFNAPPGSLLVPLGYGTAA